MSPSERLPPTNTPRLSLSSLRIAPARPPSLLRSPSPLSLLAGIGSILRAELGRPVDEHFPRVATEIVAVLQPRDSGAWLIDGVSGVSRGYSSSASPQPPGKRIRHAGTASWEACRQRTLVSFA